MIDRRDKWTDKYDGKWLNGERGREIDERDTEERDIDR